MRYRTPESNAEAPVSAERNRMDQTETASPIACAIPEVFPVGSHGVLRAIRTEKFKSGQLSVVTVLPLTRENAVMAPLILSVLRRGTERFPTLADLNRRLDDLYGSSLWFRCAAHGDRLVVGFGADLLDASYLPEPLDLCAGVLEILDQILSHPLLDENGLLSAAYVESEKELQRNEIRSLRNVPSQYASARAGRLFHRGTPAGIPVGGTEEEVLAVTPASLTAYWKKWRSQFVPDCFYIGAGDPVLLADRLSSLFPGGNGKPLPGLLEADPRPFAESVLREEEDLPAAQSHLILWFRAGGVALGCPGQAATAVAAELLGQSPVSLLFMNVREKLGLCYTVSAYYNPIHAALCVFCGLSAQNREVAEREILAQTDNLREGRFTDADLTAAKKSLRGALSRLEDRPSSLENFWFNRSLAGIRETPAEYAARVDAVTREEVVAAARLLSLDTVYFLRGTAPGKEFDDVETDEA